MVVLVCGSRTYHDLGLVRDRVFRLPADTRVIHGGAHGPDAAAGDAAQACGFPVQAFPADWKKHGRRAGIFRNLEMLDENPDLVLAFWDGKSKGTAHTIHEAVRRGIPVEVAD